VNNEVHVFVVKGQGTARLLNSCRFAEVVRAHARCGVCALYKIRSAWCGRRRIGVSVVSP
jgi:RNase P protein component